MKATLLTLTMVAMAVVAGLLTAATPGTLPSVNAAPSSGTQPAELLRPLGPDDKVLAHAQKQLRTVETLEANFDQVKHLAVMKHDLHIKGHFAVQKPDRVMWHIREPVPFAVSIHGQQVQTWDEDTGKQSIRLASDPTFKEVSQQLKAWFLGNYQVLARSYDAYQLSEMPVSLRFVPKDGTVVAKIFKNIDITLSKDEVNIEVIKVLEASGDTTLLTFTQTKINQPIKQEIWEIPPK